MKLGLSIVSVWCISLFLSCSSGLEVPSLSFKEDISVNRYLNGVYTIDFPDKGPWEVYTGELPDKINWEKPFQVVESNQAVFSSLKNSKRTYFGVKTPDGETYVVSERQIPLEGQANFRDLGGIPTKDGRHTKWGLLYRSGKLSKLSKRDLDYFANLGIGTVCDFRNDMEIAEDPDRYPASCAIKYVHLPIGDKEGKQYRALLAQAKSGEIKGIQAKEIFESAMSEFADSLAEDFQPLMEQLVLSNGNVPMLYHCTGGKDRTGFATALILSALGVERETIIDEYLMSNYYRYDVNKRNMRLARLMGIGSETSQYAFLVNEDYIGAAFKVIDEEYGGVEKYLEDKFGITAAVRAELREKYTF